MYMNYTSKSKNTHKAYNWRYSDEDLIASAAQYKHRSEWKKNANKHYQAAFWRGILDKCCAHMSRAVSPYSGDYVIYAYEFEDRHVYVGLTFLPAFRKTMHKLRGPVALHAAICSNYAHKQLETGLPTPDAAAEAESKWIEKYRADGWTILNQNKAGGLGSLQKTKWTKEAVFAEAKKYKTRQEWIDKSQMSYRIAKREGWFDEASAHMPKRVLGIGDGVPKSVEAREKMRQAKLGIAQSPEARAAKSAAIRKWWADRKAAKIVETLLQ
jgi:hypothetical protein